MANSVDLKLLIKHLSNGTLGEHLCIICLQPLNYMFENIFTKICIQENEFCVADVLESVAKMKFTEGDNYNVCIDCFKISLTAYKFHILSSRSNMILNYYCNEIAQGSNNIDLPEKITNNMLFISLPTFETAINIDFNTNAIGNHVIMEDISRIKTLNKKRLEKSDEDIVLVFVQDNGVQTFYEVLVDGSLVLLDDDDKIDYEKRLSKTALHTSKKDKSMKTKECNKCSMKCMSFAKLKEHMKSVHGSDVFICKVCNTRIENDLEYHNHMSTHTNVYQCAICRTVFKTRDNIINHLKWHENQNNETKSEGGMCGICGVVTADEESLRAHHARYHTTSHTCYYCGRLYKYRHSFDTHIRKHEAHLPNNTLSNKESPSMKEDIKIKNERKQKCMCSLCGRCFVDERALMWHQRLHNNERPFKCDVCGRAFVSLNRRTQHAVCAHTAPARRCPLCPALFHLRSMVNTHLKKVHLNSHKRRHRTPKYKNEYWKTEPVPIQELSIDIQNDIIALQAAKEEQQINSIQTTE